MTVEVHLATERRLVGKAQDNADKRADIRGAVTEDNLAVVYERLLPGSGP